MLKTLLSRPLIAIIGTALLIHTSFSIAQQPAIVSTDYPIETAVSMAYVIKRILDFKENEFFSSNQALVASREDELLGLDYMGIAINGPKKIICEKQDILPLFVAIRVSGKRDWEVNLQKNCYIVATNLNNGNVSIAKTYFDPKELKNSDEEPPVNSPMPPGLSIAAAHLSDINVRKQISMSWNNGLWALSVIYYDWVSNRVDVTLIGKEVPDPVRVQKVYPETNLGDTLALPCYVITPKIPKLIDTGALFNMEYSQVKGKENLTIYGSFSLNTQEKYLPESTVIHALTKGTGKRVAAIVPATFIMLALDAKAPIRFNWNLPVYGAKLQKGMPAKGAFAIEVLSAENLKEIKPCDYVCYLAMDGIIFGPKMVHPRQN
jgi:hypothetical protein